MPLDLTYRGNLGETLDSGAAAGPGKADSGFEDAGVGRVRWQRSGSIAKPSRRRTWITPASMAIYEIGEHDSRHYFSMGFINGPPFQAARQAVSVVVTERDDCEMTLYCG